MKDPETVAETEGYFRGVACGITIGRKEVVDWIEANKHKDYGHHIAFHNLDWQAKLKSWGDR